MDTVSTVLICVILGFLLVPAVFSCVRHFRGQGGCCGGSDSAGRPKAKAFSGKPVSHVTMRVSAMHCKNCRNRVEQVLDNFSGVSARVDLKTGSADLLCYEKPDEQQLRSAVEQAGYTVVSYQEESL